MSSGSVMGEVTDYDVIFIGNLAAVAADIMNSNMLKHHYRLALLHLNSTVQQPSLFPLNPTQIAVSNLPNGIDIVRQKIQKLNPAQQWLLLQGGRRLSFRYLVHAQDNWTRIPADHPLQQPLQHSNYSLIYSNLSTAGPQTWNDRQTGNFLFYVSKGHNSFSQNYPFLYFYHSLTPQQQKKRTFTILLEGDSFFPYCPPLHTFLEEQLKQNRFKIIYGVELQRVDYLRRVFHFKWREKDQLIRYDTAYCLMSEHAPPLLADCHIDPYNCHSRLLHNIQHDNIYIFGADLLPTTHSFHAVNNQMHLIIKNLISRLQYDGQSKLSLFPYEGHTQFSLLLSKNQKIQVTHSYYEQDYELGQERTCCSLLFSQYVEGWLTKQFYNFGTFGLPYYLFSPSEQPEQRQQIDSTEFHAASIQ